MITAPEIVARTARAVGDGSIAEAPFTEADVAKALGQFEALWDELFPAEQARIVILLVERIDVGLDGLAIRLRIAGLASLLGKLNPRQTRQAA